jgi:DNA-binding response OmpR family regulator
MNVWIIDDTKPYREIALEAVNDCLGRHEIRGATPPLLWSDFDFDNARQEARDKKLTPPDIVILDLHDGHRYPGIEFFSRLRAEFKDVWVIVWSGFTGDNDAAEFHEAQGNDMRIAWCQFKSKYKLEEYLNLIIPQISRGR